ncbi:cob(I)yrinic acid a,c-diamide adenosyltransferase [Nitrosopumilus sp. K4]|uniref:cob(I)yrinic acid a,c-diamide adenosyltransferase n=1 Tax=Nitrosopumilus sp. K4 TaxID=2795383 RepID=UPI001BA4832E|nr:cob(I)yrinic acid a,c-diamide adenosyltransferase [Nitrosopumilus sp. K4]QUC65444.1 cob(I)yrinic acid a,c-diamide adenosyltransferase [Nitrosopumilus sp. K4]
MKIYTKTGDDGTTGLQGDVRVLKSDPRIFAYGAVDEANASLGLALSHNPNEATKRILTSLQNELFVVGADLSNPNTDDSKNRVTSQMVANLEQIIDTLETQLEPLKNFILPGGDIVASQLHLTRAIIRRAESYAVIVNQSESLNENCLKYLNRISDLLFVLARTVNKSKGNPDTLWKS